MLSNSRGLTLVEIMIVLAILGGLMALLAPRFTAQLDRSKVRETEIQMGQIANALEMYYMDCGRYPESLTHLVNPPGADQCRSWGPEPYMRREPVDAWNNDFVYAVEGRRFVLRSLGADRREGGTGYDADIDYDDL